MTFNISELWFEAQDLLRLLTYLLISHKTKIKQLQTAHNNY